MDRITIAKEALQQAREKHPGYEGSNYRLQAERALESAVLAHVAETKGVAPKRWTWAKAQEGWRLVSLSSFNGGGDRWGCVARDYQGAQVGFLEYPDEVLCRAHPWAAVRPAQKEVWEY